jgi:hypothetical protein
MGRALPSRGLSEPPVSEPEFLEYKKSRSFDRMGAFVTAALNLTKAGDPERLTVTCASADALSVMSAETILGRGCSTEGDQRGPNQVVVLSYHLWLTHFGGDPGILGKSITLNNESKTVIGVMRSGFNFPSEEVDLAWARVMSRLLYGLSTTDPATFIGVAAILASVTLAASYIPSARRAAGVDPMVAPRFE